MRNEYRVICKDYCDNDMWTYPTYEEAKEKYDVCVKYAFESGGWDEDSDGNTLEMCLLFNSCEVGDYEIRLEQYYGWGHWE